MEGEPNTTAAQPSAMEILARIDAIGKDVACICTRLTNVEAKLDRALSGPPQGGLPGSSNHAAASASTALSQSEVALREHHDDNGEEAEEPNVTLRRTIDRMSHYADESAHGSTCASTEPSKEARRICSSLAKFQSDELFGTCTAKQAPTAMSACEDVLSFPAKRASRLSRRLSETIETPRTIQQHAVWRGLIHPQSKCRMYWDVTSMCLIIYLSVSLPYRIAFVSYWSLESQVPWMLLLLVVVVVVVLLVLVLVVVVLLLLPVVVVLLAAAAAVHTLHVDADSRCLPVRMRVAWPKVFDFLMDLFFLIDIGVNLRTMVIRDGLLIADTLVIFRVYARCAARHSFLVRRSPYCAGVAIRLRWRCCSTALIPASIKRAPAPPAAVTARHVHCTPRDCT